MKKKTGKFFTNKKPFEINLSSPQKIKDYAQQRKNNDNLKLELAR